MRINELLKLIASVLTALFGIALFICVLSLFNIYAPKWLSIGLTMLGGVFTVMFLSSRIYNKLSSNDEKDSEDQVSLSTLEEIVQFEPKNSEQLEAKITATQRIIDDLSEDLEEASNQLDEVSKLYKEIKEKRNE